MQLENLIEEFPCPLNNVVVVVMLITIHIAPRYFLILFDCVCYHYSGLTTVSYRYYLLTSSYSGLTK